MSEHPILMSQWSMQRYFKGKSQTRRPVKFPDGLKMNLAKRPQQWGQWDFAFVDLADPIGTYATWIPCPYGVPGDRLWFRETHWLHGRYYQNGTTRTGRPKWHFEAIGQKVTFEPQPKINRQDIGYHKRSAIFMPRWACRAVPLILDVRVERLQDIDCPDCRAEGIDCPPFHDGGERLTADNELLPQAKYFELWDTLNAKRGYPSSDNPLVWAYEFEPYSRSQEKG